MKISGKRSYREMTEDEKRKSIHLWSQFYQSQQNNDFITSWKYWKDRLSYLRKIGIDISNEKQRFL